MKFRLQSFLPCLIAIVSISGTACFADVNGDSGGDGGTISDAGVPYQSVVSIVQNEIISSAKFCIEDLVHSHIGDLIIEIAHSTSGKSATLMHRVATTSSNATGDSSDLNGTYMFEDGNPSIWSAAGDGDTNYIIPAVTYDASGVNEAIVNLDTVFGGETTMGDWTFTITDANGTETGTFSQTSVKFVSAVAVPEPGTMATIVVGTLFGGIFLRRRQQKKMATETKE